MALPNFTISPYVKPYVGNANKEVDELVVQRRQDYDLAAETADVLGYQTDTLKQNISPFEPDALYAGELMNKYRGQIDQWTERGDYENLIREVKRSTREFQQEVSPLLARRKAFDDYRKTVQEQYQKGEIDLEMHNAALNKTRLDNSNVDKATVMSGAFSGFIPTKKVDVSKMLDDAIKGMEAQGKVGKMILDPSTGTYKVVGGEYRSAKDIYNAAMSYLQGSSEFRNYASTLNALGLTDKLNAESLAGLNYVQQKYQFDKSTLSGSGFLPDGWYNKFMPMEGVYGEQDTPAPNVFAKDKYQDIKFDKGVILEDYITKKGDNYVYYQGKNGEKISEDEYFRRTTTGTGLALDASNYSRVELTENEVKKISLKGVQQVQEDSKKRFLFENALNENLPIRRWLSNPKQYEKELEAYANANRSRWSNPEYLKNTVDLHKEAVKNAAINMSTATWRPAESQASIKSTDKALDKNKVIANLQGKSIYALGADAKLTRDGIKDINSLLEDVEKEGKIVDVVYKGVMQGNPVSGKPGQRYDFIIEKDDKTTVKSVVATIDDPKLQVLQDVMSLVYSGGTGSKKVEDLNIGNRYLNATFDVVTVPNSDPNTKKEIPFLGTVFVTDKNGNTESVSIQDFPEYYRSIIPNLLDKYYVKK